MRYENFVVNQKTSIFVRYVIEEFAHAFSCAYIELWMHLGSLESSQEAGVARGDATLTHLSCSPNEQFVNLQKSTLERKENPFNKLTKDQNKRKLISYRQSCLQPSSGRHNQL